MLKGVRAARGSGPELMAGRPGCGRPAARSARLRSRLGPSARLPIWAPASDPPPTLGPSPECPSSCAPTP